MSYLTVEKINSFYGDSHILFDVTMRIEQKEVVALLGRNGAGKSTTLKSLMGLVDTQSGSITIEGQELRGAKPHKVANAGMQLVPEDRRIFGALNVEENIVLAGLTAKPAWPLERIYDMFPRLKERRSSRGTDLSGGEQQMLAIARALTRSPKVLLLDEPFEGLAPIIVRDLLAICERLAAEGQTIIIVEQNIAAALSIASRAYILNNGHLVFDGTSTELKASPDILARYVGVA
jgi:branched-chain amino acid transport system ATP-binding protein